MAPPPRLSVIVATTARRAVVLRRGPTDWTRMILWDLKSDTFTLGQWVAARIFERKCDLSPDGQRFIYAARGGGKNMGPEHSAYTGISHPPDFTANSFWRSNTTYGGGGLFMDNRTFWCGAGCSADALRQESGLVQLADFPQQSPLPIDQERRFDLIHWRLLRDGWGMSGQSYQCQSGDWVLEKTFSPLAEHHVLHHPSGAVIDGETWEWAAFDGDDVVYATAGIIWRQTLPEGARESESLPSPLRLADFSDMNPPALSR